MLVLERRDDQNWLPIDSAPKDGRMIELARFYPLSDSIFKSTTLYWCINANWSVIMSEHTTCASKSGWYVEAPLIETEPCSNRYFSFRGFLSPDDAPTHWRPLLDLSQ